MSQITIRQDGLNVLVIFHEKQIGITLPWGAALAIADEIKRAAKAAEEIAKREQVVFDSALLIRRGIPLSLATNPDLIQEAQKEAHWNSDLRRYLPHSIPSSEAVGHPALKHYRRRNGKIT